ncbi:hypothetical protein [Cohnella mopanensis]|uniref:hypothetical protein n=1 Tax=Cohnella mopanensis TaxID=2911966 RepID=UPI001EF80240|nr:hypothetical protein [Cohnella mopanensis]
MLISWLILFSSIVNGGAAPAAAVPATAVYPDPVPKQWQIDGIELGDPSSEVRGAWGNPGKIESDEWQSGCEVWSYTGGKNVGMCEGEVSFIQVTANAKSANLNGRMVKIADKDLRQALGKPEFQADDGWGVVNGSDSLKVFVDDRGNPVSLDLFDGTCSV